MAEAAVASVRTVDRSRPVHGSTAGRDSGPGVAPLRRSADVRATIRAGATAGGPGAVVHARARHDGESSRATVVAGRRIGKAVARNRAKRRLRAALRQATVQPGFDIVVVARPGALTMDYPVLRESLVMSVERALTRSEVRG